MPERAGISVALITRDEAANLRELLPMLAWADEVVVVDSGSSDATVDIARRQGCRVYVRSFDNFARQRNFACHQARCPWILSLDADERPSPALAAEVAIRTTGEVPVGYRVAIRSRILGRRFRFSGTQDDRPIRLFRRDLGCWVGQVHERIHIQGTVGQLSSWLEHETLPDYPTFLAKINRYTALEASQRVDAGIPPSSAARWLAPPREVVRRLIWKHGWLDGPQGVALALLSGLSEYVLAERHRNLWQAHLRNPHPADSLTTLHDPVLPRSRPASSANSEWACVS